MAKNEDLKKIELKVSVDCCDGCKKKVLKALSIKGVLKTEIHPTLPKLTVLGNVDAQTLIKKLAKCGKMAEVLPTETRKKEEGEDKAKNANTVTNEEKGTIKDKRKEFTSEKKTVAEEDKINISGTNKAKEASSTGNKDSGQSEMSVKFTEGNSRNDDESLIGEVAKPVNPCITSAVSDDIGQTLPQLNYFLNPGMVQASQARVCYETETNCMVPMTYYLPSIYHGSSMATYSSSNIASPYPAPKIVSTCSAPNTASPYRPPHTCPYNAPNIACHYPAPNRASPYSSPPSCCISENCYLGMLVQQSNPVKSLPPRVTEYFNDENTAGCHMM